jgi:hypothetical protein
MGNTSQASAAHHASSADNPSFSPHESRHSHSHDDEPRTGSQHSHDLSGHSHDTPNAPSFDTVLLVRPKALWHERQAALVLIAPALRIERPPRRTALS